MAARDVTLQLPLNVVTALSTEAVTNARMQNVTMEDPPRRILLLSTPTNVAPSVAAFSTRAAVMLPPGPIMFKDDALSSLFTGSAVFLWGLAPDGPAKLSYQHD